MAQFSAVWALSAEAAKTGSLNATTASSIITIGTDRKFVVTATGAFNLRMANSLTTSVTAAAATDFEFPGSAVFTLQTGPEQDSVYLFNPGASSITYWLQPLSN